MPGLLPEASIVFQEEVRRSLGRRSFWVITLLVPVLLLALLVAIPIIRAHQKPAEPPKPMAVVDLSPDLAIDITGVPGVVAFPSRDAAIQALLNGDIREAFVIPADYLDTGQVEWLNKGLGLFGGVEPGPGSESSATLEAILRVALAGQSLPSQEMQRALVPASLQRVRLGVDGQPVLHNVVQELTTFLMALAGAVLLLFALIIGASSLVQTVAEEKENRMVEVLMTSARPISIMLGKVAGVGFAILLQVLVWMVSVMLIVPRVFSQFPDLSNLSLNPGVAALVVAFFIAGYFLNASFTVGLGAIVPGVKEANQVGGFLVLPLLVPIYSMPAWVAHPDAWFARFLSFIPFTAPTAIMVRVGVSSVAAWEILLSLALLVATGVGLLWVSARLFRVGMLMYGQRMRWRTVLAALRQSA